MIKETTPVFIPVYNPKGCGEYNHSEYVNANYISRIVPDSFRSGAYTVYYTTANAAGAERHCSGTASKATVENLLNILG